jgi:NAD(P)-dependent dehydrogenase (short-subunit alcohol dehydrogenase family)
MKTNTRHPGISRRQFLGKPTAIGLAGLGLAALAPQALAENGGGAVVAPLDLDDDGPVPIRTGLGLVIVGWSSGMGAEMARQYARHGASIVLAARRRDKLAAVAAEVTAAGGLAHVIPTDVRRESDCVQMVQDAIGWLAAQGRSIDVMVLGAYRAQLSPFAPPMSTAVWQNVIATSYFGTATCLREALPHLRAGRSTVFYFNSITSSLALPQAIGYTSVKHAWRAIMNAVKAENPQLTVVSSHFNAVDTEGFDKELTMFDNDTRYCPSFFKTYVAPAAEMYPATVAVAKAIQAIERRQSSVFLSLLNKAAWLLGTTHQELSGFLTMLELVMRYRSVQQAESAFRAAATRPGGQVYIAGLLRKLESARRPNELIAAATLLLSFDRAAALFLLALDDRVSEATLASARQRTQLFYQNAGDGSVAQLMLALSSGALPGGIADDDDGAAASQCAGAGSASR